MSTTSPEVDEYMRDGCGRCEYFKTPQCKVQNWLPELNRLREILLDSGLTEERKWGSPCYTTEHGNISMLGSLRESCTVSFFKGALLIDPKGILQKPGENSQAARVIRFTAVDQITALEEGLRDFIQQAVEIEKQGLTPGRQRSHILFISGAKQPKTRVVRSEKSAGLILQGKGMHD